MPTERAAPADRQIRVAGDCCAVEPAHLRAEPQRRRGVVLETVDDERGAGSELGVEAAFNEPAPRGAELDNDVGIALLGERAAVEKLDDRGSRLDTLQRRVELGPLERRAAQREALDVGLALGVALPELVGRQTEVDHAVRRPAATSAVTRV